MTQNRWEMVFKVVSGIGIPALIGMFVWIWNTNTLVARMQSDIDKAQKEIADMRSNSTDIQLIKQDVKYIKEDIAEIKKLLTEKPK